MGNKVCCEESRTQHTVLEQVHPEVKHTSHIKEEPKPVAQQPEEEYIHCPELSQKAQLRLSTERFFFNELNLQSNAHTRRYGEDVYLG